MDRPEPKEIRIDMEKGPHRAVLVLNKFAEDAYTIGAIELRGLPDLHDDDNSFKSVHEATEAAKKIWYPTLPN